MGFRFRNFRIYQQIREFIKDIYHISSSFPNSERYGLTSQIRRAATSILLNFAEGSGKTSDSDFNRFVIISIGSANEVVAILDLCLDLKYTDSNKHDVYLLKTEHLVKQLYGLSRSLKNHHHD